MSTQKRNIADILPLSPLQEGMLFHSIRDEGPTDLYVRQLAFDLDGEIDRDRLHAAAEALLRRHANLRVGFRHEGLAQPVQVVARSVTVPWRDEDVSDAEDVDAAAAKLVEADRWARFDMRRPPLVRFMLIRLGGGRHRFLMTHHHILWDGWSSSVLLRELLGLYRQGGDDRDLPQVLPFKDYLRWLADRDRDESRRVWRDALAGVEGPTLVGPAGGSHTAVVPESITVTLDADTTQELGRCAREWGVTLNTVVQAAWGLVLSWMTGRTDVVFGATVSGRPAELAGVESMVGLFINTLPVRVSVDPAESLKDLVTRLQREQAQLADHHYAGLADVQRWAGHGELFDTVTVFENYPFDAESLESLFEGVRVTGVEAQSATHYPVYLLAIPGAELTLCIKYQPHMIAPEDAHRYTDGLQRVLNAVTREPEGPVGGVDLLGTDERKRITQGWNDTGVVPVVSEFLVERFERQVVSAPDAVAVVCGTEEVSYGELNARVNRLARVLAGRGVGAESFVGVLLPRGVDLVVTLLAVWKAGAAYVPIDPEYPAERIGYVLADAGPAVTVTTGGLAEMLPPDVSCLVVDDAAVVAECARQDASDVVVGVPDSCAAYVIYTSGSTGRPKGVVVSRSSVAAYVGYAAGA
ncbi:condensation domain-containing protein, partial [Streptomyces chlorus]